ncbi:class I SAM-dependent methyltransferase [Schlesneria paludicola]|uniref:class I SAM-dependent methyltransferase n=1 Tax=Schlesneria paludicola TaxID=360056 RepID=UPI00029A30F3|nr:class I SAM-dependent methyltransferase [Schlesneria paludicola]
MLIETTGVGLLESSSSQQVDSSLGEKLDVPASYDGSNVVFRLLRIETWGSALMNLGYYPFWGPFSGLNLLSNTANAQERLVVKALNLLEIGVRDRVLDIACGRGKSSFIAQCLYPQSTVVGIDLVDDHVQVAQTLFNRMDQLTYQVGNAQQLRFPDESFERVICIEAAFHFPDRAEFLRQAYRVLRPGGKLVVIDFAWNSCEDRLHRHESEMKLVRDVWQWNDFFSIEDYEHESHRAGFRSRAQYDWSSRVTRPAQRSFEYLSQLGSSTWGRKILEWRNPLFRAFSDEDWRDLALAVRAHRSVQERSKYMAFVFEKPGTTVERELVAG